MFISANLNEVQLHFATPILCKPWPLAGSHNPALKRLIDEKRRQSPGVLHSNRGGWQSAQDLPKWDSPSIHALTQWIYDCILQVHHTFFREEFEQFIRASGPPKATVEGWANVNSRGQWNATHNHPACHWSVVYYVQVPPGSGHLGFLDPRPNINMLETGCAVLDLFAPAPRTIEPEEGLTVVFPAWLQHYVSAHESDEERISIAFNAKLLV